MRMTAKNIFAALAACTLLFALPACSDDGGDPPPDVDAMNPDPGVNGLGQTCTGVGDCPDNPAHTCVILNIGDPNTGYCSPVCNDTPTCTTGYNGPGVVDCFTVNDPNACSINCTADQQCPAGLDCVATGGPNSFCTVAPQ